MAHQILQLVLLASGVLTSVISAGETPGINATLLTILELRRNDVSTVAKPVDSNINEYTNSALLLNFRLQGTPLARAVQVGRAVIQSANDDHGTDLKADPQVVKISNSIFSSLIDRDSLDFLRKDGDKARDVVYVTLQLTPPSRSAGHFSVHAILEVVTGDPKDLIFGDVVASGISTADSALLAQSGWSMTASLNEKKSHLLLKGTFPPILEHDLIDEKGESLSLQSASGIDSHGDITSIEFIGYRPNTDHCSIEASRTAPSTGYHAAHSRG